MASKTPALCRHYQLLPAATTKPKQPKNLDSIRDITADMIDRMGGGPQGRYTTHTIEHGRVIGHRGSGGPHPKTTPIAPTTAYDPISRIEGSRFGKEFLRMAGIVKMLHIHRPPYGAQSYIVVCPPNQNSTSTTDPYTHPRSSQIITRVGVHHSWTVCPYAGPVSP